MAIAQPVLIDVGQGRSLEGLLASKASGQYAVILLHPYSLLGGSMEDYVMYTLQRSLACHPDVQHVLAYNQAGVGRSSRRGFFQGSTDVSDLSATVAYTGDLPGDFQRTIIIGYSYGSCLAASAVSDLHVSGLAIIAPPTGLLANAFLQTRSMLSKAVGFQGPVLVVHGDADQFASVSQIQDFAQELQQQRPNAAPLQIRALDGCDHFFAGNQATLAAIVCEWISKTDFSSAEQQ